MTPPWLSHIDSILTPDQSRVRDFIINHPKSAIFVDMGGGKTLITLTALGHVRPPGHILVCAPPAIARATWTDEIEKWNIPLRVVSLAATEVARGKNKGKQRPLSKADRYERYAQIAHQPPTLYLITSQLIGDLIDYIATRGHTRRTPDYSLWPFQTIIIDESQLFKNPSSKRFQALRKVTPYVSRMVELTGTPSVEGIESLWSQMFLLDGGQALGPTLSKFRQRWMHPTESIYVNGVLRPVNYELNYGAYDEIIQRISHLALSLTNTNAKLPDRHSIFHSVSMTKSEYDAYERFGEDFIMSIYAGDAEDFSDIDDDELTRIVAANKAVLRMKLIQFASGTIYRDADDPEVIDATGVTRPSITIHHHKIEAVRKIMDNHDGSPVLVAYRFQHERDLLAQMFPQASIFDKSRDMVHAWNDGRIPMLLIHPASAGHGLNLQHGGYTMIWYTLPDSGEQYLQANARLYRMGQQHTVTIHHICVKGTEDAHTPQRLGSKIEQQQDLINSLLADAPVHQGTSRLDQTLITVDN